MIKRPTDASMIPNSVPVFPLSGALLLPNTHRPLNIFEPRYLALVDHMLATNRLVGLVQPEDDSEESPKGDTVPLKRIGCLGRLVQFDQSDDDRYLIVLEGVTRLQLDEEIKTDTPFRQFKIDTTRFASDFNPENGAETVDRKKFIALMRDYVEFAGLEVDWDEIEETNTADLINFACMMSPYGAAEKQLLLEAANLATRAETLMAMAELEMVRARSGATLQ